MKLKHIVTVCVLVISLLVCGCVGAGAIIPVLNDAAPVDVGPDKTVNPAMANDPVVGTWKMKNPVIENGKNTIDLTDARWIFGADGTFEYWPLTVGIIKTTGTWTSLGSGHYEAVCGKDSRIVHYDLADSQLQSAEDQRYLLIEAE